MTAYFYHYTGDNKVVNKTLTDMTSAVTLAPYEPLDELRGYIIVSPTYEAYNYVKIGNIYYFVTGRTFDTAGRLRIELREDVLMTLKSQLYALDCIFERVTTTDLMQAAIPDNLPVQSYKMTTEYTSSHVYNDFNFGDPTDVNDMDFVLVIGGKGGL